MKKILFVLSFCMIAGVGLNAQSKTEGKKSCAKTCAKTCSKSKTASADKAEGTTAVAAAYMEADAVADANEMIEKRVCEKSGSVSYFEKAVCAKSGKVSFNEVSFDAESKSFVNVSPKDASEVKGELKKISSEKKSCAKTCSKAEKKACAKMSKAECAKKCSGKKTGA